MRGLVETVDLTAHVGQIDDEPLAGRNVMTHPRGQDATRFLHQGELPNDAHVGELAVRQLRRAFDIDERQSQPNRHAAR